jgi:hypothetical protein
MDRLTTILFNGPPLKPIHKITDRAKRYRANADDVRPPSPRWCGFCGSRRNVEVHHVNGNENDSDPLNLLWSCRSCNVIVGNRLRKARIGRRTRQFNPAKYSRGALMREYGNAIKVMRGQFDGDIGSAVATIRATPADVRSAYTRRTWSTRKAIYGPSGRQSDIPF